MARIRTIKPDFWTDEKITECSMSARLLFIGIWNFADDNGNLQRSAKKVKMQVFPADSLDCEPLIQELMSHGMLIEYSVNGEFFMHIKGFKKHQVINRPSKSGIPQPPLNDESMNTHGVLIDGKEGKGKEEDKDPPSPPSQGGDEPTEPSADKPKRERKPAIALKTFLEKCKERGEKAISEHDPLLTYVDDTGLPMEFVNLAWMEFKRQHLPGGPNERRLQADWRKHFVNCVTKGWYKLWYASADGGYALTTVGIQAQRLHDKREAA
jgi:hypothetical protein